jgi:hypothetical protein
MIERVIIGRLSGAAAGCAEAETTEDIGGSLEGLAQIISVLIISWTGVWAITRVMDGQKRIERPDSL